MKQTLIHQIVVAEIRRRIGHCREFLAGPTTMNGGSASTTILPMAFCKLGLLLTVLSLSLGLANTAMSASYEASLSATEAAGGVDISWTSQSLTPVA